MCKVSGATSVSDEQREGNGKKSKAKQNCDRKMRKKMTTIEYEKEIKSYGENFQLERFCIVRAEEEEEEDTRGIKEEEGQRVVIRQN